MQVGKQNMFDSFLFIQGQPGCQRSGIHHQDIVYEKPHTPAYFQAGWSLQKQIRTVGTQHANVQADSFRGWRMTSVFLAFFFERREKENTKVIRKILWKFSSSFEKHSHYSLFRLTLPDNSFYVSDIYHSSRVIPITPTYSHTLLMYIVLRVTVRHPLSLRVFMVRLKVSREHPTILANS
jgi:hypothetical protein